MGTADRLDVLKALGDNTRYAIYLELVRAPAPLATADVADTLGLHANTVRPHLERMRDVGLLEVGVDTRAGRGRPQHLYSVAPGAPSLGLEPPVFPALAKMLLNLAEAAGLHPDDAADAGRRYGISEAERLRSGSDYDDLAVLVEHLATFGFDPEIASDDDDNFTVCFTNCPFEDLAESNPDLVCGLHRGLLSGVVDSSTITVTDFRGLTDRFRCQADLAFVD